MADEKFIEVPVTCQSLDVFYFEVTDKVLEETGCMCAEELRNKIAAEEIDPFEIVDGEWENCDGEIANVYYEDARVC